MTVTEPQHYRKKSTTFGSPLPFRTKSLASVNIILDEEVVFDFDGLSKASRKCFHAYGVHSVTIEPEGQSFQKIHSEDLTGKSIARETMHAQGVGKRQLSFEERQQCKVSRGNLRMDFTCCQ
ncbi:cation efflux protein [Penicillium waksmanii]|uniref:cation efflux protein n=1 Tax=Penicillium waksmanii TaxID=69791 RepID=UPI002546655D|nr:cation efflux protein [Penicillium waksmanii]KAJ5980572.1 cation efflux protein [Penicillium waksmanii]